MRNYCAWPKKTVVTPKDGWYVPGENMEAERKARTDGKVSEAINRDFEKIYREIDELDVYL